MLLQHRRYCVQQFCKKHPAPASYQKNNNCGTPEEADLTQYTVQNRILYQPKTSLQNLPIFPEDQFTALYSKEQFYTVSLYIVLDNLALQ